MLYFLLQTKGKGAIDMLKTICRSRFSRLLIFGADYFIIPSMTLIAVGLVLFRKKLDKTGSGDETEVKPDE